MKNIARSIIIGGLTLAMSAGHVLAFSDVPPPHPANESVTKLIELGKLAEANDFFPDRKATRCEFLKMLVSPLPSDANVNIVRMPYRDVAENHWCGVYVKYALLTGTLKGDTDTFHPNDPIMLVDAVRLIYRHYSNVPVISILVSVKNFTDVNVLDTSLPLYQIEQGIIDGVIVPAFPRRLGLTDALSRAEAARMVFEAWHDYDYTRADANNVLFGNADVRTRLAVLGILNNVAKDAYFSKDLNYTEMLHAAIKAFTEKMPDKYATYFPEEEFEKFITENNGNYVGMGVQLSLSGGRISIGKVFPDSPAQRAGVKAGDVIVSVNGQELRSASLDEFFGLFTRKEGEKLSLEVTRAGESARLKFDMTLTQFIVPEVTLQALDDNIAHVQIDSFGSNTLSEFKDLYQKNYKTPPSGVIIDMRDNPGGDMRSFVDVASLFVPRRTQVAKLTDNKAKTTALQTVRPPLLGNVPVVTLVNGSTSSAAEMLAMALRDLRGAPVIGVKTVGKGTVQRVYSYSDGSGFRQTIYAWSPVKSPSIEGVGIIPDREATDNPATLNDEALQVALEELGKGIKR